MTYQELRDAYGPTAFKLYAHFPFEERFLNPLVAPKEINFKTGLPDIKPQKKIIISSGEVESATYFAGVESGDLVHPLAMTEFDWVRVDAGDGETRLSERNAQACWALVGESDDEVIFDKSAENVKTWPKLYDERTGRLADKRKRANIIDEMLAQVGPFGVLSYVQTMLNSLDDERNGYIDTYDIRFINKVMGYAGAWLETDVSAPLGLPDGFTLRMAILGSLDYDRKVVGQ